MVDTPSLVCASSARAPCDPRIWSCECSWPCAYALDGRTTALVATALVATVQPGTAAWHLHGRTPQRACAYPQLCGDVVRRTSTATPLPLPGRYCHDAPAAPQQNMPGGRRCHLAGPRRHIPFPAFETILPRRPYPCASRTPRALAQPAATPFGYRVHARHNGWWAVCLDQGSMRPLLPVCGAGTGGGAARPAPAACI